MITDNRHERVVGAISPANWPMAKAKDVGGSDNLWFPMAFAN